MSRPVKFAFAAVLVLAGPVSAEEPTAATVVATVNGIEITVGHLIVARKTLPAQYLAMPDDVLFQGILDQLVQQTALAEIGETGMSTRDRLVIENERRAYLAGSVLDNAAIASVTDETLEGAYAARYSGADPSKEFNAAHILVGTEEEAKALREKLDGGADFTALAKEVSTGPSGANGGELGWFSMGMMVKPFEDAVVLLEPGQFSDPVQTEFGWHIIRLNETRLAAAPEMAAVRAELESEIQTKAVEARIAEVTGAATVVRSTDGIDPAILKNEALLGD